MEDYVFEMLKIFNEYNAIEYDVLNDIYAELRFTQEQFVTAYETIKHHGFIVVKAEDELDPSVVKITPTGKKEYELEKSKKHEEFTKSIVERKVLIGQDRFQELSIKASEKQIEIMESQLRLNQVIEESNTSAINTNSHTRQTNKILVIIFFLICIFSFLSLILSFLSYRVQEEKSNVRKESESAEVQYQLLDKMVKEKNEVISHQAFIIDSLKKGVGNTKGNVGQ